MTEGEIILSVVTAITGVASLYLTSRNKQRTQESRDRASATAEWKDLAERLRTEVDELREELSTLRVAVQQLGREHEECHRALNRLRAEIESGDIPHDSTMKDIKR